MSIVLDTKTKEPWPAIWVNRALQRIRAAASADLVRRDEQRGIANGQVYRVESETKGEHQREVVIVDRALAAVRHTGRETRLLANARFKEFCSQPQSLDDFIASFTTDDALKLQAAKNAAAPIEESIPAKVSMPKAEPEEPAATKAKATKKTD